MNSTIFVDSLTQVDMSRIKMPMAVIYDSPKDFPELKLCRMWWRNCVRSQLAAL